jgi:hypothetical protein
MAYASATAMGMYLMKWLFGFQRAPHLPPESGKQVRRKYFSPVSTVRD